jgi:CubicO group peptidase (beta-lactamase class C family)
MMTTLMRIRARQALLTLLVASGTIRTTPSAYAQTTPSPVMTAGLAVADSLVQTAIAKKLIPGAVLVVSQNGRVLQNRAFGYAQLYDFNMHRLDAPRVMHTSTLFDLASVSKVMATTFAVMMLVDRGRINLDVPVYTYLPDFRGPHRDSITVRNLLTHSAGLVQWQPLYYHASNEAQTYDVIRRMPLQWGVGEGRHYSDLGFMLLGYIVERVSGQPLDAFLEHELYRPLGLRSTSFLPTAHGFTDFAATEQGNGYERHMVYDSTFGYRYRGDPTAWNGWRQYVLNGETNDGNSWYANGGVAGHAGLFSTAADLRVLLDLLNNRGSYGGHQYIRASVVDSFLTVDRFRNYLGWMKPPDTPDGSFMHNGFTGTYVIGVPNAKLSIVLLTNKQNVGVDNHGYFSDVRPLDESVTRALVDAATRDGCADKPQGCDALPADTSDLINPDRPGIADGSRVIGPGQMQLEFGLQEEHRGSGTATRTTTLFIPTLIRFGVSDRFELRIETNSVTSVQTTTNGGPGNRTTGYSPVSLGFKYGLYDSHGDNRRSLGAIVRVFAPSGSAGFGNDRYTADARLAADWDFAPNLSLNPNVGIARYEDGQARSFTAGVGALTLNYLPSERLNPFVDIGVQTPEEDGGTTSIILDTGMAYIIGRDVQLDFSIGRGVHGTTPPRPFIGVGFSVRSRD